MWQPWQVHLEYWHPRWCRVLASRSDDFGLVLHAFDVMLATLPTVTIYQHLSTYITIYENAFLILLSLLPTCWHGVLSCVLAWLKLCEGLSTWERMRKTRQNVRLCLSMGASATRIRHHWIFLQVSCKVLRMPLRCGAFSISSFTPDTRASHRDALRSLSFLLHVW